MWMYEAFSKVLNMSLTASVVIGCVMAARLGLKKAPKVFSYVLWAVVLFRLLCPVSVSVEFSVLGLVESPVQPVSENASRVEYVPEELAYVEPGQPAGNWIAPKLPSTEKAQPVSILPWIWMGGMAVMAMCSLWSMARLKKQTDEAVCLRENIYEADRLDTAFVIGLVRARIYLPSGLTEQERRFILLHEEHHVKRMDHVVKLVGFLALCIHWFNPLVWAAFALAEKDMEMSCDEAVMKRLGEDGRCDYSQTLLRVSSGRRRVATIPLAFGEGNTKERVKNVLNWKKPKMWVGVICGLLCVSILAACAVNPEGTTTAAPETGEPECSVPLLQTDPVSASELERGEYEHIREQSTRTVKVDLTAYANIEIELPDGWEYEIVEYTDDCYQCGVRFWPGDRQEGKIGLYYFPQGFGVCGTGLETEEMTLQNGNVVTVGYYDGSENWCFASLGNDYAACAGEGTEAWPEAEWGTALEIVCLAKLNQGVISREDALKQILAEGLLEQELDLYRADFDAVEGIWKFTFYENSWSNPVQTVRVAWDGTCG